ncbi:hypothetical protein C8R47DRAFT_1068521 [Mycena vitilis]|nr:hypothetical protein C8R47DRAFT_1068521 [Mycena vitilis]
MSSSALRPRKASTGWQPCPARVYVSISLNVAEHPFHTTAKCDGLHTAQREAASTISVAHTNISIALERHHAACESEYLSCGARNQFLGDKEYILVMQTEENEADAEEGCYLLEEYLGNGAKPSILKMCHPPRPQFPLGPLLPGLTRLLLSLGQRRRKNAIQCTRQPWSGTTRVPPSVQSFPPCPPRLHARLELLAPPLHFYTRAESRCSGEAVLPHFCVSGNFSCRDPLLLLCTPPFDVVRRPMGGMSGEHLAVQPFLQTFGTMIANFACVRDCLDCLLETPDDLNPLRACPAGFCVSVAPVKTTSVEFTHASKKIEADVPITKKKGAEGPPAPLQSLCGVEGACVVVREDEDVAESDDPDAVGAESTGVLGCDGSEAHHLHAMRSANGPHFAGDWEDHGLKGLWFRNVGLGMSVDRVSDWLQHLRFRIVGLMMSLDRVSD